MKVKNLLLTIIVFVMSLLLQSCDILNNKAIKNVKESRTIDYPDVTLGDTISYFTNDAVWSGKMEVRQDSTSLFLVSVKGTFDLKKIILMSIPTQKLNLLFFSLRKVRKTCHIKCKTKTAKFTMSNRQANDMVSQKSICKKNRKGTVSGLVR